MESSPNIREIADPRLIAGYLRDALLNEYIFVFEVGSNTFSGKLNSVTETAAREKTGPRTIEFNINGTFTHNELQPDDGNLVKARVAFERMLLHFKVEVIDLTAGRMICNLPEVLTLIVYRKQHRFSAQAIEPNVALLKLVSDETSWHGLFQLGDVSKDGFGGLLFSRIHLTVESRVRVAGQIQQDAGAISIKGNIAWVEPVEKIGPHWYRVGIVSDDRVQSPTHDSTQAERRRDRRVVAAFPIEIVSPLFPETVATLHLENLSMRGLKAKILNKADKILFREQLEVTLKSPRLRLRILSIHDDNVTFSVMPSSLEEHIKLSGLICAYSERDIISSTAIGSDFLQIFTLSGSISSSLAKNQSLIRRQLQKSIQRTSVVSPWFIRWNQQAEDGTLRASIMTALYGEHVWYLGALAGHLDPELRMSKDFIPRFYRHLADFLNGLGRHEYLLFNWFVTNSYWNEWEAELSRFPESDTFFRFRGDIVYFSDLPPRAIPDSKEIEITPLSTASPGTVERLLQKLPSENVRNLFRALGLTQFSYGCRTISELLEKNHHSFLRDFYYCDLDESPCFITMSRFPIDSSPNGILNYPFVYAVGELSERQLDLLSLTVLDLASSVGVYSPAYFLSLNSQYSKVRGTSSVHLKEIIWTFATQDILEYWRHR